VIVGIEFLTKRVEKCKMCHCSLSFQDMVSDESVKFQELNS
jgi:hypothetical protein